PSQVPGKRSGHSFTIVGSTGYLFGGVPQARPPGPTNEMFKLDMSNPGEFYWQKVKTPGRCPAARWHHAVAVRSPTTLVLFGGFRSSSIRFNDLWLLDTKGDKWSQPPPGITEEAEDGVITFKKSWKGCPDPRGSHSGNLIGNSLIVFGGYGGPGFSRRDFNDVHVLDMSTWEWVEIEATGEQPEPRSGHQVKRLQNKLKDTLYVCGGWNSVQQFNDLFILDTKTWIWTKAETGSGDTWGPPRWNHSAVGVFAVPHWKVFVFGGNSGNLAEGGNPQSAIHTHYDIPPLTFSRALCCVSKGDFLNDLCVLNTGSNTWTATTVVGELPEPRSDTQMIYDGTNSRLLLFGGWANKWWGELHVCSVGEVVGPPYSLESVSPGSGAITGATQTTVRHVGILSGSVSIRFACTKGFVEAEGAVVNDTEVSFLTPSFEKFGPMQEGCSRSTDVSISSSTSAIAAAFVECRLSIGTRGLTNTKVNFQYFSVGDATNTVAFGPGLLRGIAAGVPVEFIIQARDK
ncbi:unnamed protein product, partial [Sphacelaria rigidula]